MKFADILKYLNEFNIDLLNSEDKKNDLNLFLEDYFLLFCNIYGAELGSR